MEHIKKVAPGIRTHCTNLASVFRFEISALLLLWMVFFQIPGLSGQTKTPDPSNTAITLEEAQAYLDEADIWLFENSDSAYHYGILVLESAQELNADSLIAKSNRIIGISHYFKGNFYLMAEHCEFGLETEYAAKNRAFAAKLWNNLGIAYEMLDDFDNAIFAYNNSMELERLIQNESGYHVTKINLGLLHSKTGNSARGLEILELALEYFIEQNDSSHIALTYQNIGKIHYDQRNHPIYDEYAKKALQIYKRLGDSVKISEIYYNRAVNAHLIEDYENWEYFLNKANELQLHNKFMESHIIHHKGLIALHKGNYTHAENYLRHAFENFVELESTDSQRSVYMSLLKLYANKGDLKMHDQFLFELENHMEKSLSAAMLKRYAELDYKYENTRTKKQLQQYQYFNEQQVKAITLLRIMLIIVFILVLGLAGLVYRLRSRLEI